MDEPDPNTEFDTRNAGREFVDLLIAIAIVLAIVIVGVIGMILLTSIIWLPLLLLLVGVDFIIQLLPIRWLIRNTTVTGVSSESTLHPLLTFILLLPGALLTYRGFIIHRRHIQIVGFIIAFVTGGIFGAIAGLDDIGLLVLAALFGLIGSKLALTMEVAIAVIIGLLSTALASAFIFSKPFNDPLVLLFGIIGAAIAWRAHVLMIILGTAATGAAWMTFVSLGAPLTILESISLAPLTLLFLYLLLTGAGIQLFFVEQLFGPIEYIEGNEDLHEDRLDTDEIEDKSKERNEVSQDNQPSDEFEYKLIAIATVFFLSLTSSVLIILIGTIIFVGPISHIFDPYSNNDEESPTTGGLID